MSNLYNEMLFQLLSKNSLTREAIGAMFNQANEHYSRYNTELLKRALDKKHIRLVKKTETSGRLQKQTNHYSITPEGIRYLSKQARLGRTDKPWLAKIRVDDTKKIAVLADNFEGTSRYYKIAEAALMSEVAGARVPLYLFNKFEPYDELILEKLTPERVYAASTVLDSVRYSPRQIMNLQAKKADVAERIRTGELRTAYTLMSEAQREYAEEEAARIRAEEGREVEIASLIRPEIDAEAEDFFCFVTPTAVKYVSILQTAESDQSKHDTDRGRYAGLLQSHQKALLVYGAHNPAFSWEPDLVAVEEIAFIRWARQLRPSFREGTEKTGLCGVVLIQSARDFKDVLSDKAGVRSKKTHKQILGSGMNHLYTVAITKDGADDLREIMLNDEAEFNESVVSGLLELGYTRNRTGIYEKELPVVYDAAGDITYIAIGYWMDMIQIQFLQELSERDASMKIALVCKNHQKEYYEAVLPNVQILAEEEE